VASSYFSKDKMTILFPTWILGVLRYPINYILLILVSLCFSGKGGETPEMILVGPTTILHMFGLP